MLIKFGNITISNEIDLKPDEWLAERLKHVRIRHNLSVFDVADLSSIIPAGNKFSSGALNRWENQKTVPDLTSLITFAEIFGIDIYWLAGNTQNPYDNDMLLKLEHKILARNYSISNILNYSCSVTTDENATEDLNIIIYPHSEGIVTAQQYIDDDARCKLFQPACRANIIFLLNRIKFLYAQTLSTMPAQALRQTSSKEWKVSPLYLNSNPYLRELRYFKLCNDITENKFITDNIIANIQPIYNITTLISKENMTNILDKN